MNTFTALRILEQPDGTFLREFQERKIDELPEGEVLIRVMFSALNYKDALSASGHKGITRKFPHTPGIDAAGVVEASSDPKFMRGKEVIVTSYDLGMNTDGGFGQYIRVPASWVIPKPRGLSLRECMIYGTAGLTAGLALYKMEQGGQSPDMGSILVTGATGGVGSMAVALFAKAGYTVIASTGKQAAHDYLKNLGAARCENREFANDPSSRPLLASKWAGAVDTVGGNTLATALKACGRNGNVATTGLVASPELQTTVYPFILNGVNLLGIESGECPMNIRRKVWNDLAAKRKIDHLEAIAIDASFDELNGYIDEILDGKIRGRVVLDLWK